MTTAEPVANTATDSTSDGSPQTKGVSDMAALARLLRQHVGAYTWLFVGVAVLQVAQAVASLYLPTLNADLIDNGIALGDTGYIWRIGGIMLAVTVAQVALAIGAVYCGARAALGVGRDLRRQLFHHVLGLSTREVGRFGSASLITRNTNDVQQLQQLTLMTCTVLVTAPITMIGGVVLALRQDVGLSALLLVSIPVLVAGVGMVITRLIPQFQKMQLRIDSVNGVLREQLMGVRVVRAFTREPEEIERFGAANAELTATSLRAGRLMAFMSPIVLIVLNVSSVAALWIGSSRVQGGSVQIGELIAFLSYLTQILGAVMTATFMTVLIPRAAVSAHRIYDVLETRSSVTSPAAPVATLPDQSDVVRFDDVGFHYPGADAPVLTGIDFTARRGQTMAVIGGTGSGKSTLLNLIPRLFDATSGTVQIDDVDVRDVALTTIRDHIGLVPQTPFLFAGSVASNLRFSNRGASDAEIWDALRVAQADEFVTTLDGGLDARIEQGGSNVSGGQRQRLAMARALVDRPGIYLFDDSFSSLDAATDARVRAGLRAFTEDAIVVIVGQRVSSIRDADQILVLDDGHQVGLGTHDELLVSCPTYAEIVDSQQQQETA